MTQLDSMLDRILIDLLSDRIIERMKGGAAVQPRSALVVFAGTDLGLEAAIAQMAQLQAAGWSFEAVFAPDALALTKSRLADLVLPEADGLVADLLARYQLVLVPTLSLSLAAKVAVGIADDRLSLLLQGALERGIRVIAARDGVCPNGRDRRERGLLPNAAYQAVMSGHLQKISEFGVELSWAARLVAAVNGKGRKPATVTNTIAQTGVFGLSEARGFAGDQLQLGAGVIVTPAAAEELRAREIRLVRSGA